MPLSPAPDANCTQGLSKRIYVNLRYDVPWAASAARPLNSLGCPTTPNGFGYKVTAVTTGTTGGSEPTWPVIIGNTVVDGGVTWTCQEAAAPSGKGSGVVNPAGASADAALKALAYATAKAASDAIDQDEEAWNTPSLLNSWVAFGGSDFSPGYMKDAQGVVHLRGSAKSGTVGAAIFNLPAAYRPTGLLRFAVVSNGAFGDLSVASDGNVFLRSGSNVQVNMDGITFDTR